MAEPGRVRTAAPAAGLLGLVERRLGLTPTGLLVGAIAALAWPLAYLIASRAMFLMVYAVAALFAALAVAGRRSLGLVARRSALPARIREGQTVPVEIEIGGKRRIGTVVVEERLDRIREPVRVLVPSLGPGRAVGHRYAVTPALRGVYSIGPLTAVWSDPFGLTRRRTALLEGTEVIVHPATEPVADRVLSREWEDPPIRPPVSKPWPTGFEFYGMRDYVPGDDPRRIVWRAVARTGRYLVREAEQGITDRVTIVLDDDPHRHAPGDPSDTFEAAVRAVASLGVLHLREGFVVTVEAGGGTVAAALRGPGAQLRLLDALARVRLAGGPLADAAARVLAGARRDTHHVIVAPHLDHRAAGMLRILTERGGSVGFVHVQGPDPDPGSLQRAAALGCSVVELRAGVALAGAFAAGIGAGIRR